MSLLPSSPEVSVEDDPRVVGLDSDEADALMRALSSDTAREMLSALHEEPLPPSKLAGEVDTTLQNAQYHLERLSDAGAIEVVGTAYSEKGREMDVYAPADKPLVIFAGREDQASGIRAALRRLVGGLFALLFGAVAVQEVFGRGVGRLAPSLFGTGSSGGDGGGAGGAGGSDLSGNATSQTQTSTPEATPSRTPPPETTSGGGDVGIFDTGGTATETAAEAAGGGAGGTTAEPTTATPAGTPSATAEPTMDAATAAPEATSTATEVAADGGAAGATPTPTPTPVNDTVTETVRMATEAAGAGDPAMGLPPGVAFFLGGAIVLGVAVALSYR